MHVLFIDELHILEIGCDISGTAHNSFQEVAALILHVWLHHIPLACMIFV